MGDQYFQNGLEQKDALFRAIVCQSGEGISICSSDGRYLFVNQAFCELTGYSPDEFGDMTVRDFIPPETDLELFNKVVNQQSGVREVELRKKNGQRFWVETRGYPIRIDNVGYVLGTIRDITKRKNFEKRLKESEEKFRAAFHTSPNAVNLNRLEDGAYVEINEGFTQLMGYRPEDVVGKSSLELSIWKKSADRDAVVGLLKAHGTVDDYEAEFIAKSGDVKIGQMSARIVEIAGEKMILSITRDMTRQRQSEETMALLEFAINHTRETVYLVDELSRITYVNDAACEHLGYARDELLNMTISQIDPEFSFERWQRYWQDLMESGSDTFETVNRHKNGTIYPVEVSTNIFSYHGNLYSLALTRDITERKRNEEERKKLARQMEQANRLESLGVLAGGIAHDFNNLLAVIMGQSELSLLRLPPDAPVVSNIQQILQASERAAALAKQMLAFSGKGQFVIEAVDLNRLIEDLRHALRAAVGAQISLDLTCHEPLPRIDADATQLRQVIMNLVVNAGEAIGDEKGTITVASGWLDYQPADYPDLVLDEHLTAGRYVYLDVTDTGAGMDKSTLDKLFDPFFTTKFTGRGLGMSAVLGIVRGHHGAIQVCSEVGRGTAFRILFPVSEKADESLSAPVPRDGPESPGKVLLVDDEASVRAVGKALLEELGGQPLTAVDGVDALRVYRENPETSLVILDLTMPRMDGLDCCRELKSLNPNLAVVISSGYSEKDVSQKFSGQEITGFIQKPYRLSELKKLLVKI